MTFHGEVFLVCAGAWILASNGNCVKRRKMKCNLRNTFSAHVFSVCGRGTYTFQVVGDVCFSLQLPCPRKIKFRKMALICVFFAGFAAPNHFIHSPFAGVCATGPAERD